MDGESCGGSRIAGGDPHQVPPVGSSPTASTSVSAAEEKPAKDNLFGKEQPHLPDRDPD